MVVFDFWPKILGGGRGLQRILLSFYECRLRDGDTEGSGDCTYYNQIRLNFLHSQAVGMPKHRSCAPSHPRAILLPAANEVVAKVMFLQVSVCPRGEGVCLSACWDAIPLPQDQGDTHPGPGRPPPDQADPPPGTRQIPPGPGRHPPDQADPPPGKQTSAYGLRAAGTHPTGMHSCETFCFITFNKLKSYSCQEQT